MLEAVRRLAVPLALAGSILLLLSSPGNLQGYWEAECVYNPPGGEDLPSCCQCNGDPETPTTCEEDYEHGGTHFCSADVCPIDEEPCWEPGGGAN